MNEEMTPAEWHNWEEYGADIDTFGEPGEEEEGGKKMIEIKVHDKAWFNANCVKVRDLFGVYAYVPRKWERYGSKRLATVLVGDMERQTVGKVLVVTDAVKSAGMANFKYMAVESGYYLPLWAVEWVKETK